MQPLDRRTRFERIVLPHLEAGYNLARWLTGNGHDAEDVLQEACVRAFTFLDGFRGADARAWLLSVVRNTCYTWLEKHRGRAPAVCLDEQVHGADCSPRPEQALLQRDADDGLQAAVAALPAEFREVLVLRELEGLSYKEIAAVLAIPLGTVMSRLTRARTRLQRELSGHLEP